MSIDFGNGYSLRSSILGTDLGDSGATTTPIPGVHAVLQRASTTFTANRTVTLSTTEAQDGDYFMLLRDATTPGAFTWDIGGIYTFAKHETGMCVVHYDGSSWFVTSANTTGVNFGEIYTEGNASSQTTNASAGVFDLITQLDTAGKMHGTTLDVATNYRITVSKAGVYKCDFSGSFSGTASSTFTIKGYIDGSVQENMVVERKLGTGGDVGQSAFVSIGEFPTNTSYIDVRVASDGTSDTFLLENGNLNIFSI